MSHLASAINYKSGKSQQQLEDDTGREAAALFSILFFMEDLSLARRGHCNPAPAKLILFHYSWITCAQKMGWNYAVSGDFLCRSKALASSLFGFDLNFLMKLTKNNPAWIPLNPNAFSRVHINWTLSFRKCNFVPQCWEWATVTDSSSGKYIPAERTIQPLIASLARSRRAAANSVCLRAPNAKSARSPANIHFSKQQLQSEFSSCARVLK